MHRQQIPLAVFVRSDEAAELAFLFGGRGFRCHDVAGGTKIAAVGELAAAIVDLDMPHADRAIRALRKRSPRLVVIGLRSATPAVAPPPAVDGVDVALGRPLEPARLFATVVELIAARRPPRNGGRARQARITGVVGPVRGNPLFERTVEELHAVVAPVNAGAILETVLHDAGTSPHEVLAADLAAVLGSARLRTALEEFAPAPAVAEVLRRVGRLAATRA